MKCAHCKYVVFVYSPFSYMVCIKNEQQKFEQAFKCNADCPFSVRFYAPKNSYTRILLDKSGQRLNPSGPKGLRFKSCHLDHKIHEVCLKPHGFFHTIGAEKRHFFPFLNKPSCPHAPELQRGCNGAESTKRSQKIGGTNCITALDSLQIILTITHDWLFYRAYTDAIIENIQDSI